MGASSTKEKHKVLKHSVTDVYQVNKANIIDFNHDNENNFMKRSSGPIPSYQRENNNNNNPGNLDQTFEKTHKCQYTLNELQNLLSNFIQSCVERHYSYIPNDGENVDKNDSYYLLRKFEEEKLIGIIDSKKREIFTEIKNKLSTISPEYDYISLINKIFNSEKGTNVYYEKFIKRIDSINQNRHSPFEIEYHIIYLFELLA